MTSSANQSSTPGKACAFKWALILLVCLMLVAAAAISVSSTPPELSGQTTTSPNVYKVIPAPLDEDAKSVARLDLDALLDRVAVDEAGGLVVDAQTATALEEAASDLPGALPPAGEKRARFLILKSLPAPAAERLADLLVGFQNYQEAQRSAGFSLGGLGSADDYEKLVQLQVEHFGEADAQRLFGQRNALMRAMLEQGE